MILNFLRKKKHLNYIDQTTLIFSLFFFGFEITPQLQMSLSYWYPCSWYCF